MLRLQLIAQSKISAECISLHQLCCGALHGGDACVHANTYAGAGVCLEFKQSRHPLRHNRTLVFGGPFPVESFFPPPEAQFASAKLFR